MTVWNNKEQVLKAVASRGWDILRASESLRSDAEVVSAAAENNPYILERSLGKELRNDADFMLRMIKHHAVALRFADKLKTSRNFILKAVKINGRALLYAGSFRADREIVLAAVHADGLALNYARDRLRADLDVISAAIQQNPDSSKYAIENLTKYRKAVLIEKAKQKETTQRKKENRSKGWITAKTIAKKKKVAKKKKKRAKLKGPMASFVSGGAPGLGKR